jgi:hypothetical protein
MKNLQIRLLPLVVVLFGVLNTAFVVNSKTNTPTQSVEGTPQYKTQKRTFFKRFIVEKAAKRLESATAIDLDKTTKSAKTLGGYSIPLILVGLILAFIPSFAGIIASLIVLALAGLLGIIALYKAYLVLKNPNATEAQKDMAKKGRRSGGLGLVFTIITFAAVAIYLAYRLSSR